MMKKATLVLSVLAVIAVALAGANTLRYYVTKSNNDKAVLELANALPTQGVEEAISNLPGSSIELITGFVFDDGKLSPAEYKKENLGDYIMLEYNIKCKNVEDAVAYLVRSGVVVTEVSTSKTQMQLRVVNKYFGVK